MSQNIFAPLSDLPSQSHTSWRKLADQALRGASFERRLVTRTGEGVDIQPLYEAGAEPSPLAEEPPFLRGAKTPEDHANDWWICSESSLSYPKEANEQLLRDLAAGADALWLTVALDDSLGAPNLRCDAANTKNLRLHQYKDLIETLHGVELDKTPLFFGTSDNAWPIAANLVTVARETGVELSTLRGGFGCDPLGALAREGTLGASPKQTLSQAAMLAKWSMTHTPQMRTMLVNLEPFHSAGASPVDELALSISLGLAYLRALNDAGLSVDDAAAQLIFSFCLGCNSFTEIAKLRAARALWARVIAASGGSAVAQTMHIHAETSPRVWTQRSPWNNILRGTLGVFAASIAGIKSLRVAPMTAALNGTSNDARRLARNTQLILRHESHLNRVIDPAGGSHYVEQLTQDLIDAAWPRFQEIERAGGAAAALLDGSIAALIAKSTATRNKRIATRRHAIIGLNVFPNLSEKLASTTPSPQPNPKHSPQPPSNSASEDTLPTLSFDSPDALMSSLNTALNKGATLQTLRQALAQGEAPTKNKPLPRSSDAAPFEALRDACDARTANTGNTPSIFLANLGAIPEHKPRAAFATHFFGAAGLVAISSKPLFTPQEALAAFQNSGASLAVICSSDKRNATLAAPVAQALHKHAAAVILAARPGDAENTWREAGIQHFIHLGCDALTLLDQLLHTIKVLP